jgi:hypothetical protein
MATIHRPQDSHRYAFQLSNDLSDLIVRRSLQRWSINRVFFLPKETRFQFCLAKYAKYDTRNSKAAAMVEFMGLRRDSTSIGSAMGQTAFEHIGHVVVELVHFQKMA